ncbi:hypothetical protein BFU83_004631 [Escherichia coli]|nr:hypothetical protein [Escherichia coli]
MKTVKESEVNSQRNVNRSDSTVKGENGYCIISSMLNGAKDSYIQNYMAVTFDAVTDMNIKRSADVTSFPVETGSDVSDNVRVRNDRFSLKGIISETPVALRGDMLAPAGASGNRVSQAIEYFDQILDTKQPITLLSEHRAFENVILTGIEYTYKTESAIEFTLTFERIRLVSTATTNAIATKTAAPKSTGGQVKTKVPAGAPQGSNTPTVDTLPK